jgi:competence protein ComEA
VAHPEPATRRPRHASASALPRPASHSRRRRGPGSGSVFALPAGSLVEQAIEAAGGPDEDAWVDAVNLAARLQDGDQVRIPYLAAAAADPPSPASTPGPQTPAAPVNLNTASASELDRLPGIGPSLAKEIIAYRESHGAFAAVEDLLSVPGIGPAKLAALHDLVCVN